MKLARSLFLAIFAGITGLTAQTHPRLFFDAAELTQIRTKLDREPFKTMLSTLEATKDVGNFYLPIPPNDPSRLLMRASAEAMLYSLTGIEQHAVDCKADVVAALALIDANNDWADSTLKGLTSYWYATRTSICYDLCYNSPSWDSTFKAGVSARLLSIATMIINNGGTEQNTQFSSNWQANRASSGGIALLATDETYDDALMVSAMQRLNNFFNANQGSNTRGWNPEGVGYTAYLYGSFVGPFAIALDRLQPARSVSNQPGMKWMPWTAFSGAVPATANNPYNVYGLGGVKTDWSDDNAHIGGEGLYGLAFRFSPPSLLPGLRHSYDRLQGSLAPDGGLWDASRHGIFWSILYYPENTPPQNPLEIWDWQDANGAPVGLGLVTFRDGFRGENDILVHFKARTKVVDSNSHDGPDGLGFRILGPNAPFVVGGGRDNPGRDRNQATIYPNDPNVSPAANKNAGTYHGTPLIKPDGSGHAIASMTANNVGTTTHKRWIVTDFDRATTGADATVIVADTSGNGRYWQLPTYLNNTVTVTGSVFTITGQNGATLQGTIIHPGGTPLVTVGTKARGQGYTLQNGGTLVTESVSNPQVLNNRYLYIENTTDNNFLVVMTIQKNGGRHPVVARNGGTIADAVIQVGGRSYGLQTDNVLYDGVPYVYPNSTVTFSAGPNGSVSGSTVQSIAHGAAAAAPTATPDAGFTFAGWSKAFNKVTAPMTVTALFTPTAGPTPTLALAVSSWRIDEAAGTATIGVTRSGSFTGAVGVSYATANGSATAGDDYTATSGTLSWADGDGDTKTITIPILQDTVLENDEDFTLSLSAPTGGAVLTDPASAVVTISDDESLPLQSTLAFTNQNVPVNENGGSVSVSVARLLSTTGAVTVNYITSPGTAASGVDYTPVSGTLSWADGEAGTKSFNVTLIDDSLVEPNEIFTVNLSNPTGGAVLGSPATASVTILENEVNVQPMITINRPTNGVASISSISQSLQLASTTSDDGEPGPLTFLWEKISGPGSVTFGNAASEDTFAAFSLAGVYQLRLTASDGLLSDSKIVLVNVAAAGGTTQRFAEYPFTHAANDPTPLTPTVVGSNITTTASTLSGVAQEDSSANLLRLRETGGTGGLSTSFSNSTDHVWVRLNANPGYYFDLTSASSPRIQFQMGRITAPAGTNIVGRMQVWAAATGSATTASPLVYTSPEITATSSTLVTMNDTSGIAALNSINRYSSLLVQVQWKGTASATYGTLTMDNILVDGAVVAAVDNVGPSANAGADTTAQTNTALPLSGSATDDGLPASPGTLTYQWQKVSGPGNVVFANAGNPATTATFDSTGIHVLSLSADDGAIATSDTVTITVTSDVPLPPAPASGLATNAIAHNRIDLSWTDNSGDETGFKILRSLSSGSGFTEIGTAAANATSYSDVSCVAETTYFYQIVASNATGDSTPSSEDSATTPVEPPPVPGTIRLAYATYQTAENAASVTLTAQRIGGLDGEVSVSYATADGSATAGADYTAASDTLTWPSGDAVDKTVVITLLDDSTFEGNETFIISLTGPAGGATLDTPNTATVTILDNEVDPTPTPTTIVVTPANPEIAANATQQFSAVLNDQFGQPITPQPSFAWSVSGGGSINSAGLFTAGSSGGSFTVTAGAASLTGTTTVTVTGSGAVLVNETWAGYTDNTNLNGVALQPTTGLFGNWTVTNASAGVGAQNNGSGDTRIYTAGAGATEFTFSGNYAEPLNDFQDAVISAATVTPITGDVYFRFSFFLSSLPSATGVTDSGIWMNLGADKIGFFNNVNPSRIFVGTTPGGGTSSNFTMTANTVNAIVGKLTYIGGVYTSATLWLNPTSNQQSDLAALGTKIEGAALTAGLTAINTLSFGWEDRRATSIQGLGPVKLGSSFADIGIVAPPANTAPTISAIADQTIDADTSTSALPVTIGDVETAAASLTLSGASSNPALVPNENIVFSGSGANRSVTVTPVAGQSGAATITVAVSDGTLSTPETFELTVTPAGIILPGEIRPGSTTYQAAEIAGSVTLTVQRSGGSDGVVSVSYFTANDSATAGDDYTAASGSLTWLDGDSANKEIIITLLDDASFEGNETFTLTLSEPLGGATLGTPDTATVTILEDDADPTPVATTIAVTPAGTLVSPFGTQQFSAVLKDQFGQPLAPQPSFNWNVSGGGSINAGGLFTAGSTSGTFTVSATAGALNGSTGVTVQAGTGVTIFSAFFNDGTGTGGDDNASAYGWTSAVGTGGVLDDTLASTTDDAQVGVSQGVTSTLGVPILSGQSTSGGFLFALPDAEAGVSLLHTTHLLTSDSLQDNPQADWNRDGDASLSGLKVGEITGLSVYTRPASVATTMRFAILAGGQWYVSTTAFNQTNTAVFEQRTLGNLTAANAWYSGVFTPGSALDADLTDNPTATLSAANLVTGYGWYADTDGQTGNDSRVRIDSFQVTADFTPPPASGYATWSDTAFPEGATPAEREPGFDYENDGLSNLLEYGLGTDPAAASTAPAAQFIEITGQKYLQIQWTRPDDRTDITTLGEISNDLTPLSWSSTPAEVLTTITPAGVGLETVTIRDADPFGANTRRFLRARIQLNAP